MFRKRTWWKYVLNFEVLSLVAVIIAVIYFSLTLNKNGQYDYIGIGKSGWDVSGWKQIVQGHIPQPLKKRKKRINRHEEKCREIFSRLFQNSFKSVRPQWLKNPATNKNLELDGFCPHIRTPLGKGLAFEYDGEQHSKYNKHFHRNGPKDFLYQIKKDEWKTMRCKEEGILLIRIPHFVAYEDLESYIIDKLKRKGVNIRSSRSNTQWRTKPGTGFLAGLYD